MVDTSYSGFNNLRHFFHDVKLDHLQSHFYAANTLNSGGENSRHHAYLNQSKLIV